MVFQPEPDGIVWRLHLASPPETVYQALDSDDGRASLWAESAEERNGVIHFEFINGERYAARIIGSPPCVSPTKVAVAARAVSGRLPVAAVCGFPSGAHPSEAKIVDATHALTAGASEIDMVVNLGLVADGRWDEVEADIAAVRGVVPSPAVLKVIIESAILSDDQIVECCRRAEAAGADYVRTSTGFHAAGGAGEHAVRLMADTVGGRLGVKASGGIRTREAALTMIEAGATRIGTSSTAAILGRWASPASPGPPAVSPGPGRV